MNCRSIVGFRFASLCVIAVAAVVVLGFSGSAGAYLYWGDAGGVARADLTGAGVDLDFVSVPGDSMPSVALGSQSMYIGNPEGVIARANLNGSNPVPDLFQVFPTDKGSAFGLKIWTSLVTAGEYLYWPVPGVGDIGRVSTAGGEAEPRFITAHSSISSVAIYAGKIYWCAGPGEVGRANLDGSDVEENLLRLTGTYFDIAVADGHIYWTTQAHSIGRSNLDGREVDPNFITLPRYILREPAVGGNNIYWKSGAQGAPTAAWIGHATLKGTRIDPRLINVKGEITSSLVANALGPQPERHPVRPRQRRP